MVQAKNVIEMMGNIKDKNLVYTGDIIVLMESIKREIARVAASSASEDGQSLYDGMIYTSRDEPTLRQYLMNALRGMASRLGDVMSITGDYDFCFYLPDMDVSKTNLISNAIDKYLMNNVVAQWLLEKGSERAESYSTLSSAHMDQIVTLMKTRIKPQKK